ncbi:MAG: hypothetical protein ACOYN2_06595 [Patescibacteria group bacterium]
MKNILLVTSLALLLVSCGSTDTSNVNLSKFEGKNFSIEVPKTWTKVEDAQLPKPKNGTIMLALTSTDISSGFANNLLVLKDTLQSGSDPAMTSRKYAVINSALTNGNYKAYTKLSDATFKYTDNDEGLITTFEAQYNDATPKQKFLQTAKICGKDVYLMTIGLAYSTSDTAKYEAIFKTFTCVK